MAKNSEDKVLAGIAHLGIVVGWVGLIIAAAIYLIRKDQSLFIKRSAKQALGYQIVAIIVMQILVMLFGGSLVFGVFSGKAFAMGTLGLLLVKTVNLIFYALGIWAAVRAFLGEYYAYPVIGEYIERL